MEKIVCTVSLIRSRGLIHRQFKAFLTEVPSDLDDVVYFSHVRWLSLAATRARFSSTFVTHKGKDVSFMDDDDECSNDLAFLVAITKYLADLNVKLQGKDQFVSKLYEHVQTFIQKRLMMKKVVHFHNAINKEC